MGNSACRLQSGQRLRPSRFRSGRQWSIGHLPVVALTNLMILATLLGGCTMVGPDYVKPSASEPQKWLEERDPRLKAAPSDYADWWALFEDPVLNSLVENAYQQNLPLQIAGIRILQARAQLGIVTGNLYPQTQIGRGEARYDQISKNQANTSPGLDRSYWDFNTGFDAAWEVDIWGKFRRGVEAGVANLRASIASYDDALVSLTAEVARTYLILRTFEERLGIARQNVKIQEESLRIADTRFKGGAVTELDVQQAKALLTETQSLIPRFQASIRQAKNVLATLLGKLPGELDTILGPAGRIPNAPGEVVMDIPADLLRRRPDIRLAEYQVATQSPQIGIAKAQLYPAFSLFGSLGIRSSNSDTTANGGSNFGDLFSADSIEFSGGPAFAWNLFNYGRIRNQVRAEDALFQQLVVNYQNTVLSAYQEVEDALIGFLRKQDETHFLSDSVAAWQRAVDLSLIQYREGLVDYQRVLDSQRSLSSQQDVWTTARGDVVVNLVALYKALGGGWQIREGKDFVKKQIMEQMQQRTNWNGLTTPAELKPPTLPEGRGIWRKPDW